jgi:ferredoxin--NADP+ reductase
MVDEKGWHNDSPNCKRPAACMLAVVGYQAGFYAIESLLKADAQVRIDIFERLPTPFGLVRSGVPQITNQSKG